MLPQSGTKVRRKAPGNRAVTSCTETVNVKTYNIVYSGNCDAQKAIVTVDIDSTLDNDIPLPQNSFRQNSFRQKWSGVFIIRQKGVFHCVLHGSGMQSDVDGHTVDPALIEALRVALNEPPLVKPNLKNLGITPAWFREYSSEALNGHIGTSVPKQVVARSFGNPAVVQRAVRDMFNDRPGDFFGFFDVPDVIVTVTFDDDSVATISGAGFFPFLLSWSITRNGKEIETYNANISRALAALMPPEAINRDKLAGQLFAVEIVDAVTHYVELHWKRGQHSQKDL